jgi:enoyl-CoA hydratase/carnithine racemase
MVEILAQTVSDGICRLTLTSPQSRNALSEEMIAGLSGALKAAEADDAIRVIVLAAEGSVFCAGHDLKQMTAARRHPDHGRAYYSEIMARCSAMMQQIVRHPKPVIAEVAGIATAAGCQLVASCDLAVAGKSAKFATPGVQIGLFCSTPMVALSRNVSRKHAMEMLLTGDFVSAERAEAIGLVNQVVADADVTGAALTLARKITSKSQMTLQTGKKAFYEQAEMGLADAYHHASQVMVDNMLKQDAEEGINAFIEKRKPEWKDE